MSPSNVLQSWALLSHGDEWILHIFALNHAIVYVHRCSPFPNQHAHNGGMTHSQEPCSNTEKRCERKEM